MCERASQPGGGEGLSGRAIVLGERALSGEHLSLGGGVYQDIGHYFAGIDWDQTSYNHQ